MTPPVPLQPEEEAELLVLRHANTQLKAEIERQNKLFGLFVTGKNAIRVKAWSSPEDYEKAQTILTDLIRSLLPS